MKLGAASLVAVLIAAAAVLMLRKPAPSDGTLIPVADDVYTIRYHRSIPWLGVTAPVHVFLMKTGEDYMLCDVGAPDQLYTGTLLKALKQAIGRGQLRLVLLTHGHSDHVGALEAVVQQYPEVQVVHHEQEAPHMTGGVPYNDIPSDHDDYNLTMFDIDVSAALPKTHVLHLRGARGDLADAFSPSGSKAKWLPRRGAVQFYHAPGHSPGLVAYLHKASGSLLVGDIITQWESLPGVGISYSGFTANTTLATISAKAIAALDFSTAYPVHDKAMGVSKSVYQKWAQKA